MPIPRAPRESRGRRNTDRLTWTDSPTGDADAGDGYATETIKRILEAALLVAGRPLAIGDFEKLFGGSTEAPPRNAIRAALAELAADWSGRSLALQEVASGWRAQVRTEFEPWIARLWDEKPPRYSRALLETLAIIAYRQPMTRSEIEDIRGVSVSSGIIRTLTEREWIRVVGHREAPGRPAMYGTTREFLDYFNLKTLDQLPPISDIKDLEGQYPELGFEAEPASGGGTPDTAEASSEAHDEDGVETEPTGDPDPEGASADAAETNNNTVDTDDLTGDAPSMEGVDDGMTTDVDAPSSTDGDAGKDEDDDEDDAEDSSCIPAS
ncbi:MAG: SMC-Scp complex subunit ScpB [Halofilum sp. (in: g-proteobacteria)]|nr:SMC-Scp complex subunit ScpB [Halofilum sp. (in: g-proteobacteria)]